MKKSNGDLKIKNFHFVMFLVGLAFFFASMIASFWAAGYHHRTKTPPLVKLTLSQPACEYLSQSGIAAEVKIDICMITARYREIFFRDSGYVEMPGKPPLTIRKGLIISVVQLDDGSDEPWSDEHKKALRYMIGSMFMMIFSVWLVIVTATRSVR